MIGVARWQRAGAYRRGQETNELRGLLQEKEVQLAEAGVVLREVKKGHAVRQEALAAEKADVVGELEASFFPPRVSSASSLGSRTREHPPRSVLETLDQSPLRVIEPMAIVPSWVGLLLPTGAKR